MEVRCAESGRLVVPGVAVRSAAHLGLRAEATGSRVQFAVRSWNQSAVEAGGGEGIFGSVQGCCVKDFSGLFCHRFAQVVVVLCDPRSVSRIAWNHGALLLNRFLQKMIKLYNSHLVRHIVGRSAVMVIVRPLEKLVLSESLVHIWVAHAELGLAFDLTHLRFVTPRS